LDQSIIEDVVRLRHENMELKRTLLQMREELVMAKYLLEQRSDPRG
jgi:hypothetical protein